MIPLEPKKLEIDAIKDLKPAFCSGYGWLSLVELNLLDPNCDRFEIMEEVTFVDNSVFCSVIPANRDVSIV